MNSAVRIAISFVAAGLLVFFATGITLLAIEDEEPKPPSFTQLASGHNVRVLSEEELQLMLRRAGRLDVDRPEPPSTSSLPPRQIRGFVQLEYTVNPDGSVSDVNVIGAVPEGYYEAQAKAMIEAKRFTPTFENGKAVASEHTTIIDFSVPAKE